MTRGRAKSSTQKCASDDRPHIASCRSRARNIRRYDARQSLSMLPNTPSRVSPSLVPPSLMPGVEEQPDDGGDALGVGGRLARCRQLCCDFFPGEPGRQLGRRQIGGDQARTCNDAAFEGVHRQESLPPTYLSLGLLTSPSAKP